MNEGSTSASPITIFYSYAEEDWLLQQELEKHLSLLRHQGLIAEWHHRRLLAGTDWKQALDTHLMQASVILLLISPDFMASDYCYGNEMRKALDRHKLHEACVIPVLLRPVDWHEAPFAHLSCLPSDGRSVTSWPNQDEAFANVARGIREAIGYASSPQPPVLDEQGLFTFFRLSGLALILSSSISFGALLLGFFISDGRNPLWGLDQISVVMSTLFLAVGLPGIQVKQAKQGGWLGIGSTVLLTIAMLFDTVMNYIILVSIKDILAGQPEPVYLVSFSNVTGLLQIVGSMLLGIAILRAAILPRWTGVLLIIGSVISVSDFLQLSNSDYLLAQRILIVVLSLAFLRCGYALLPKYKTVGLSVRK